MNTLFCENIGKTRDVTEARKIAKEYANNNYDEAYVALSVLVDKEPVRKWLDSLWTKFSPYVDSTKFPEKFKYEFHQRAWELYLGCTFLENGYELVPLRGENHPDLCIKSKEGIVWIEAVVPKRGTGQDRVPDMVSRKAMAVPHEQMQLRLLNALVAKKKQFDIWKKNEELIGHNDKYIIAINRGRLEHVDALLPEILKCLYSAGDCQVKVSTLLRRPDLAEESKTSWTRKEHIKKKNKEPIKMNFFEDNANASVSAIIYCKEDVLNCPKTPKGKNFALVHNNERIARNPLLKGLLGFVGEEWVKREDAIHNIAGKV